MEAAELDIAAMESAAAERRLERYRDAGAIIPNRRLEYRRISLNTLLTTYAFALTHDCLRSLGFCTDIWWMAKPGEDLWQTHTRPAQPPAPKANSEADNKSSTRADA
eukprot:6525145-Pyramimonas_sp.AAC.1